MACGCGSSRAYKRTESESPLSLYSGGNSTSYAPSDYLFDMNKYLKHNPLYKHGNHRYKTEF